MSTVFYRAQALETIARRTLNEYDITYLNGSPRAVPIETIIEKTFGLRIGFAKSYAQSKGLVLDTAAVDCWDNPIRAGSHCIYLERDIQSRLNRYANDEDITDVWIWAESVGNDCYDIYIGYA